MTVKLFKLLSCHFSHISDDCVDFSSKNENQTHQTNSTSAATEFWEYGYEDQLKKPTDPNHPKLFKAQ